MAVTWRALLASPDEGVRGYVVRARLKVNG
jgi:hypothetical protein